MAYVLRLQNIGFTSRLLMPTKDYAETDGCPNTRNLCRDVVPFSLYFRPRSCAPQPDFGAIIDRASCAPLSRIRALSRSNAGPNIRRRVSSGSVESPQRGDLRSHRLWEQIDDSMLEVPLVVWHLHRNCPGKVRNGNLLRRQK
jgi:hypothetical protein